MDMAKPKTAHPNLPPRMVQRSWKTKRGKQVAYYYEHPRDEHGKRQLEPLGTNLASAKKKWGEIEGIDIDTSTPNSLADIYQQYMKWANKRDVSGLSIRTLKDRTNYWNHLKPVFSHINIDDFQTSWFHDYFEKRSSQVGAKKEIKFLSVLFNWAKARGKCKIANPITGTTRLMSVSETRTILITEKEFNAVLNQAQPWLADLMRLLYIAGLRPSEAINLKFSDIKSGELIYKQSKTSIVKRIPITGDLQKLITRRKKQLKQAQVTAISPTILFNKHGQKLTLSGTVRNAFNKARDKAQKSDNTIRRFQLRDIRPFAATSKYHQEGIEATRKFLGHSTEAQTRTYIRGYIGEKTNALNTPKTNNGESKIKYGESS